MYLGKNPWNQAYRIFYVATQLVCASSILFSLRSRMQIFNIGYLHQQQQQLQWNIEKKENETERIGKRIERR